MTSITKSVGITIGIVTLFVSFFASPEATYAWGDEVIDGGCCGGELISTSYPEYDMISTSYPESELISTSYPEYEMISTSYPESELISTSYPEYELVSTSYPYSSYSYDYGYYGSSYSYPSYYGSYGYSSYPASVDYSVPVGYSTGGYSYGGSYGYPVSYASPVTVASGVPAARPATVATPTSIANVDNSINIVDNSINDSFNTTTIMNSFNSGSGTVVPTYHPAPSCTISVTGTFGYGQTLTWHTYNANTASVSRVGAVAVGYGTRVVYPTHGQIFTMTVSGQGGTATCQSTYAYAAPVAPTYPTYPSYPTAPYVALTQIPYTGFDFGPIGNSIFWAGILSIAAAGAYLVVYYRGGVASMFVRSAAESPVPVIARAAAVREEADMDLDLDDSAIRHAAQDRVTRDAMRIDLSMGMPRLVIARQ